MSETTTDTEMEPCGQREIILEIWGDLLNLQQKLNKNSRDKGHVNYGENLITMLTIDEKINTLSVLVKIRGDIHHGQMPRDEWSGGIRNDNSVKSAVHLCLLLLCLCQQNFTTTNIMRHFRRHHKVEKQKKKTGKIFSTLLIFPFYLANVLAQRDLFNSISMCLTKAFLCTMPLPHYFYVRMLGRPYHHPSLRRSALYPRKCLVTMCDAYLLLAVENFLEKACQVSTQSRWSIPDSAITLYKRTVYIYIYTCGFIKVWARDIRTVHSPIITITLTLKMTTVTNPTNRKFNRFTGPESEFDSILNSPHDPLESGPITPLLRAQISKKVAKLPKPGAYETKNVKVMPKSECLLIHCHGGGFVTQSTKAQEVFLREWATALEVPILSIDYSLAPEARYPRPLEEVLTVYCWILNNYSLLGTNATKIVLTAAPREGLLLHDYSIICVEEPGSRQPVGWPFSYISFWFCLLQSCDRISALV
ncbi:unnamed protein product, partial [Meganyctiphanes norvegica]